MAFTPPIIPFTPEEHRRAWEEWGCNCGPTSLSIFTGKKLNRIRECLSTFEEKKYTSPKMMKDALKKLGIQDQVSWIRDAKNPVQWPLGLGMARIQWAGPWTNPGVPLPIRYRHTHWIATSSIPGTTQVGNTLGRGVFDCNCPNHWVSFEDWRSTLVPYILSQCETKANGKWWVTDSIKLIP
jgi:hypothetical protein